VSPAGRNRPRGNPTEAGDGAWWNKPHKFSFRRVQLESIRVHPAGDLFNAAAKVTTERCCIIRATTAISLYVVGILMHVQHD